MRIRQLTTYGGQEVSLGAFTVLVGANNVGKSRTLRDIHDKIITGVQARSVLIDAVTIDKPTSLAEVFRGLHVADHPTHLSHKVVRGITSNLISGDEVAYEAESFARQYEHAEDASFLLGNLGRFRVAFLDAGSRLSVAAETPSFNKHLQAPSRLLQALFGAGPEVEADLRLAFHDTFGMDIRLDYSGMTQLVLRVAEEFAPIPPDPRDAFPIMSHYATLDSQGDGFQSFVGVVLSLLLSQGRIILLDEPEAFLHPAQARQLGYWVAAFAERGASQIIVATHNSNFLAGILARGAAVEIYRLNRTGNETVYNKIAADSINKLTKAPLLSSQAVLDAVFHRGVVVCEGDGDRAIYQTVAVRRWGSQNVLFLHAQSKQTVKDVIRLLRAARIPAVGIVDFDILDSETELASLCDAFGSSNTDRAIAFRRVIAQDVEGRSDDDIMMDLEAALRQVLRELEERRHSLSGARSAIRRVDASATRWADAKRHGVSGLPEPIRERAVELISMVRADGLFIVPVGELESWIDLGTRQKKQWVIKALESLFENRFPTELGDFVADALRFLGEDPKLTGSDALFGAKPTLQ